MTACDVSEDELGEAPTVARQKGITELERLVRELNDLDATFKAPIDYAEADVLTGAQMGYELRKVRGGELRKLQELARALGRTTTKEVSSRTCHP